MPTRTNRLARHLARRAGQMEALEPRTMLAATFQITDVDEDIFEVVVTGPGSGFATMGPGGVQLLAFQDTQSNTDITINRLSQGEFGNGDLFIHRLETGTALPLGGATTGDIDELRTDAFVYFRSEEFLPLGLFNSGILINGRARIIRIDGGLFGSDINITSTANANLTSITINEAYGLLPFKQSRGPGFPVDTVEITSGGIINLLDINEGNFIRAQARRFNTVLVDFEQPLRGPIPFVFGLTFEIQATDANAPFGIKTLDVEGAVSSLDVFSNSPVQSILMDEVTEDVFGSGGDFRAPSLLGEEPPLLGEVFVQVNGRLGTFKARTGGVLGTLEATTFGTIDVRGVLDASIRGFFGAPALSEFHTSGIDSLRAGFLLNSVVEAGGGFNDGTGFIKSMIVGEIEQTNIVAGWIGTLNVSGSDLIGADGDVRDSNIFLTNTTRVRALDSMTVADQFTGSGLIINDNNAGTINLNGGFGNNSRIQVGVSNLGVLFTGNPFNGNNRGITLLRLKAPIGDGQVFQDGFIAASFITTFTSTLRSSATNTTPGTEFGVVADSISSISFRRPNNSLFTTPNTTEDYGDLIIRVI